MILLVTLARLLSSSFVRTGKTLYDHVRNLFGFIDFIDFIRATAIFPEKIELDFLQMRSMIVAHWVADTI